MNCDQFVPMVRPKGFDSLFVSGSGENEPHTELGGLAAHP